MSMLGEQIKELREAAEKFEGYQCGEVSRMLRKAADTIESLRDRLQELQGVTDESRYSELFGTPERAARTLAGKCGDCCECVLIHASEHGCDDGCLLSNESNFDKLLEWLRSESDGE